MVETRTGTSVKQDHEEITILAVDDERDVVELTGEFLAREDERFAVLTETSARDGVERLATADIDCVVSDYDMPGMNGLEFLRTVREEDSDLPFILFTGKGSEEIASEAISAGVTDYLQKGSGTERYELLATRIMTAVGQYHAERELERQNDLFTKSQDLANVGAWEYNLQDEEFYFTDKVYEIYGVGPEYEPAAEKDIQNFYHPDDRDTVRTAFEGALQGTEYDIEVRITAADGTDKWVRTRGTPQVEDGTIQRVRGTIQDITDRKERERELEGERERYRSLFENNPLVIWEEDLSAAKQSLDELANEVSDVENYLLDNPEELNRLLGQTDVVDINRSALEYYNAPSKDALLDNPHQIFTEEGRETLAAAFDAFAHGATRFRGETVAQTMDGERKHELLEAFVPEEYADDYSRVYVTGTDITERKQQERALEKEREFIEQSLDTLDDILYLVDTNGDFERWNSTLPERTGYSDDEIGSINSLEFFEGEHRETIQMSIRNILETGSDVTEAEITTADGRAIPHEFRGVRMTDDDGNPTGIIGIARDITERKRREERLIKQNEQLEEFVGLISHDLRNPLNVAESRLSLADEECDSEHLPQAADAITRSQALIEDLLRLAREDEEVTDVEPLELAVVAERSWDTVETGSAKLNLETSRVIHADQGRLLQLFESLYRNAIEHGGDEVTVNVGDTESGFYVADTGSGIPESERDEIFDAGYSTADDGTGFGLRIVEQIAEAHEWGITVTEGDHGGARFEITGVKGLE